MGADCEVVVRYPCGMKPGMVRTKCRIRLGLSYSSAMLRNMFMDPTDLPFLLRIVYEIYLCLRVWRRFNDICRERVNRLFCLSKCIRECRRECIFMRRRLCMRRVLDNRLRPPPIANVYGAALGVIPTLSSCEMGSFIPLGVPWGYAALNREPLDPEP